MFFFYKEKGGAGLWGRSFVPLGGSGTRTLLGRKALLGYVRGLGLHRFLCSCGFGGVDVLRLFLKASFPILEAH